MISEAEIVLRLVMAAFLGGCVGLEREVHGRPAGVRTYLVLSLGSALLMILSEYLIFKFKGPIPGVALNFDPGRIAGQAITGIGFLGAGVILRYKDSIHGLTTAACVWVACAIGLAVGGGFYFSGSLVAAITVISLVTIKGVERKLRKDWYQNLEVISQDLPDQWERVKEIIDKRSLSIIKSGIKKDLEGRELTINLQICQRAVHADWGAMQEIFSLPGVKSVNLS